MRNNLSIAATAILYATILFSSATAASAQSTASAEANICTGHPHGTLVRNVANCSSYFNCFNGIPLPAQCEAGLLFDHLSRSCVQPNLVDCFQCPRNILFVDVFVPNECQQFVRCFNDVPQQMTCANGLSFDRSFQMCNLNAEVSCPFSVQCPNSNLLSFIRHRDDCARFYTCIGGGAHAGFCPEPLFFNLKTGMCDFPENTECPYWSAPLPELPTEPELETYGCPETGGPLFPSHEDCRVFYTCDAEGNVYKNGCNNGLYFHWQYMVCVKESEAVCYTVSRNQTGFFNFVIILLLLFSGRKFI